MFVLIGIVKISGTMADISTGSSGNKYYYFQRLIFINVSFGSLASEGRASELSGKQTTLNY